jgi:hypothetical protein
MATTQLPATRTATRAQAACSEAANSVARATITKTAAAVPRSAALPPPACAIAAPLATPPRLVDLEICRARFVGLGGRHRKRQQEKTRPEALHGVAFGVAADLAISGVLSASLLA